MNFDELSVELKTEYKELCELCEHYSRVLIPLNIKVEVSSPVMNFLLDFKDEVDLNWDNGDSGYVFFADADNEVSAEEIKKDEFIWIKEIIKQKYEDFLQEKINEICSRIEKWELETGLEFDGC